MVKIEFPISGRPKCLDFPFRGNVSFPIHIGDLWFELSIAPDKVYLALKNGDIGIVQDVGVMPDGIKMMLRAGAVDTLQEVFITFEQIGVKICNVTEFDSYSLNDMDSVRLDFIPKEAASWIGLTGTMGNITAQTYEKANDIYIALRADSTIPMSQDICFDDLSDNDETVYLAINSGDAGLVKRIDIAVLENGLAISEGSTSAYGDIYVTFEQIGLTLDDLDAYTLKQIDPFPLNGMLKSAATWLELSSAVQDITATVYNSASDIGMATEGELLKEPVKNIYFENLHSEIGVIGLSRVRKATLRELDPYLLNEVDEKYSTLRFYDHIPANLTY